MPTRIRSFATIVVLLAANAAEAGPMQAGAAWLQPAAFPVLVASENSNRHMRAIQRRREIQRQEQRRSVIRADPFGPGGQQQGRPSRALPPSGSGSMTVPNR